MTTEQKLVPVAEARKHATELEQCAIFAADVGPSVANAMTDAAEFLRTLAAAPAAPAQEPVAWIRMNQQGTQSTGVTDIGCYRDEWVAEGDDVRPLYAAPVAPAPVAVKALDEVIGALDEVEKTLFAWSGSAFLANEAGCNDADCKTDLYSELCKLGNVMSWAQRRVRACLVDACNSPAAKSETQTPLSLKLEPEITRDLLGKIVDEVFDGAIEDASVIEDIYRVIARECGAPGEGCSRRDLWSTAARSMLTAYDAAVGAVRADVATKADGLHLVKAAAYGVEAYEVGPPDRDHATVAMLRAMLTAIIDPADPSLDYLRASAAPGEG